MNLTNYNLGAAGKGGDQVFTFDQANTPINVAYQCGTGKGFGGNGYNQATGVVFPLGIGMRMATRFSLTLAVDSLTKTVEPISVGWRTTL